MKTITNHISVCVCTYQRPQLLSVLLAALEQQVSEGLFDFSIVVVDNDSSESARSVVQEFSSASKIRAEYFVEKQQNIALARNKAVSNARGEFLAFIDDDELPEENWLLTLLETCKSHDVGGVLGPVVPRFEHDPPEWLTRGGFYNRTRHDTGFQMKWHISRTGNVLIRRKILEDLDPVFSPSFGAGGEDLDFFRRLNAAGHTFIWCDSAPVHEVVPPHRCTRKFLLHRALLRGNLTFLQPENRWRNIAKSAVAFPLYVIALPFLFFAGQHVFMNYLVRSCDHLGRLLAGLRLNPVLRRPN